MKVRTQGQVVKMVVILVEEEKMREILVVVVGVVDRSLSPILSKGRKVTINPIPTTSKGKAHLLTALNTARRDSLPLGRVGVGL